MPNTLPKALLTFVEAVVYLAVYMFIYPRFSMDYLRTEAFQSLPWWKNIAFVFTTFTLMRFKYYFAWKLSDTSIDICGLSYKGTKKN